MRLWVGCVLSWAVLLPVAAADLEAGWRTPPDTARPGTYYFVMDGNQSREGLTADLEALQRVGVRQLCFMEVDLGQPRGPVKFMSPAWRELFVHLNREAARLGLEVTVNTGPGWTGSGGPWVKPEQSMQKLVFTETAVTGPRPWDAVLPQPAAVAGFYRDVTVLAFPRPAAGSGLSNLAEKALWHRGHYSSEDGVPTILPQPATFAVSGPDQSVARSGVVNLSARLGADGRLTWQVPPGEWVLARFGRTTTGMLTRPAPEAGLGLECDKLDRAAVKAHFDQFLGTLLADLGPLVGRSLTAIHIDSWEMQSQNWSAGFAAEFQRRRGYDPLPWLVVLTGRVVDSVERSERFLWDLRETVRQLVDENYAGYLRELAHERGLRFSIEPYDGTPVDDLSYGAQADVPMCEFWSNGFNSWFSAAEASSIAHVYGRPVVQAEAFTAAPGRNWQDSPGSLKAQGDIAFCEGINRFFFHRYAHQPWLDRWPGQTFGPYGINFDRTNTWFEPSRAWIDYLARCQFLLQQGQPVADALLLTPEASPQVFDPSRSDRAFSPNGRGGHNYDGCTPEALLARVSVRDGRLVLPEGTSYAALFLPRTPTMTPRLLTKVSQLLAAGATVVGPRPVRSPSLSDDPAGDRTVQALAAKLWGPPTHEELSVRRVGRGRLVDGTRFAPPPPLEPPSLAPAQWIWTPETPSPLAAPPCTRWFRLHLEVAAGLRSAVLAMTCDNRFALTVNGQAIGGGDNFHHAPLFELGPQLRAGDNLLLVEAINEGDGPNPAALLGALQLRYTDGHTQSVLTSAAWQGSRDGTTWTPVVVLGPAGMAPWGDVSTAATDAAVYLAPADREAVFGRLAVPPDFESDTPLRFIHRRDGAAEIYFVASPRATPVTTPATFRVSGRQPELWDAVTGQRRDARTWQSRGGRTTLTLSFPPSGSLFVVFRRPAADGGSAGDATAPRAEQTLAGPWSVAFDPRWGGPAETTWPALSDWTQQPLPGVRYYSGTASYRTHFRVEASSTARRALDLGRVEVIATVRLNGHDCGTVWTPPYQVDVSDALRLGDNELELRVTNLWPNRMIGDLARGEHFTWAGYNPYRADSPLLPSGLLGPVRLLELR